MLIRCKIRCDAAMAAASEQPFWNQSQKSKHKSSAKLRREQI